MSQSRKGKKGRLAEPPEIEKPPDSPVSPLLFRGRGSSSSTATTSSSSSSSSSSGSPSGRNAPNPRSDLSHSGFKPANAKSPAVLPGGNIFPSGKVLTTGMAKRDTKSNVLGSGAMNYGYGSIMQGQGLARGRARGRDNITKPNEELKMEMVSQAGIRGNDLFKSQRYTESCAAYDDGLRLDPSNSVLYYNRAACWYKMGEWEKSVNDCNQALHIHPNYTKALLRRAASKMKLELWAEAVRDYEVLSRELPHDNEVAESLSNARGALLKKSNKFGEEEEEVEIVSGFEQFRAAILLCPGVSVLYFKAASNVQCWEISAFLDKLRTKYPSINFLKVDVEDCPLIANAENVKNVPTFKFYNKGQRVKDLICPSPHELEALVRNYCI